jgi:5'-nucleotidase
VSFARLRFHNFRSSLIALALFGASCASHAPATAPASPAVPTPAAASGTVDVQLLAINDFHGALEPPAGSNGRIGQTVAGGIEYMATHLAALAKANPNTVIVSAGDNIGATPLLSGMFHDEPSIEALSTAGVALSAVGNHELDEGWDELYRIQNGGCHPVDGCQDHTPFAGAAFRYLTANILVDPAGATPQMLERSGWKPPSGRRAAPLFAPYEVRTFNGVKVGFIGLTLQGVGSIVSPNAMKGLVVRPEVASANEAARALRGQGVHAIVVLIHEGGVPTGVAGQEDPNGCAGFQGPIIKIANEMSPNIDVIVSGHTHRAYICTIGTKLVTSASSFSRVITDIDLQVDRATGQVTSKTAHNVIVTRDVEKSAAETALLDHYRPLAAAVAMRPVGSLPAPVPLGRNAVGESALGDIIADGMLEAARGVAGRVDAAFTNSGGIRSDLVASGANGTITFGDLFNVLPFGNIVMVKTLSGDAIARMLEQQTPNRVLQISSTVRYAWDPAKPQGKRVNRSTIEIGGKPIVRTEKYRIVSNDFVWNGGDEFVAATEGIEPVAIGTDVDIFLDYIGRHSPVTGGPQNRIRLDR